MGAIATLWGGLASLLKGLRITFGHMMRKPVTLQYPAEKAEISAAYRGAIQLIRFDETNSHDCVACLQCEKICPSFCISIEGGKVDGIKKKRAEKFTMDFALCSLCGLCLDVCPTTTLEYSKAYDVVSYQRDFEHDLLAPYRDFEDQFRTEQQAREKEEARLKAEAKKKKAARKAAEAEKDSPDEEADS